MSNEPTYDELFKQLKALTSQALGWKIADEYAQELRNSQRLLNKITRRYCTDCLYSTTDQRYVTLCQWRGKHQDLIPIWMGRCPKLVTSGVPIKCPSFLSKED